MTFKLLKINLQSPVNSLFQADTIWGHICWAVRYIYSEKKLTEFLEAYDNGEPPLVISDGLVENNFSVPVLPSVKLQTLKDFENEKFSGEKIKLLKFLKFIQKISSLELPLWKSNKDSFNILKTMFNIYSVNLLKETGKKNFKTKPESHIEFHNSINRFTGMVKENGGFFSQEAVFYPENAKLDIYLSHNAFFSDSELKSIFEYIALSGFGADSSTGKGSYKIASFENFAQETISTVSPNAWVSLSTSAVPKEGNFYYNLFTKYPKLGGEFSKAGLGDGSCKPFKKPLLLAKPGMVAIGVEKPKGSLLKDVHTDQRIKHYSWPLWIGFKMEENLYV